MTDVLLYDTPDGGEITVAEGRVELTDTLETAAYLCLFGGNERDSGSDGDKPLEWWGNKIEPDPAQHYRSEFQFLLATLPVVPANLRRFEDAATRDLQALVDAGLATNVLTRCRITSPKRIELMANLEVDGRAVSLRFEQTGSTSL